MAKSIESYTVEELQALIAKKQEGEVNALKEKIKETKGVLSDLEKQLEKLTGKAVSPTGKRGKVKDIVEAAFKKNKDVKASEIVTAHPDLKATSVNVALSKLRNPDKK